jgi:hypothetical protein
MQDFETRLSGDMLPYLLAAIAALVYLAKIRVRRAT